MKFAVAEDCIRNPRERQQITDHPLVSASGSFAHAFGWYHPEDATLVAGDSVGQRVRHTDRASTAECRPPRKTDAV
jgi:hypothetical protein